MPDKNQSFDLAKKLREAGLINDKIGDIVARSEGRDKSYSGSTISGWMAYDSYKEYAKAQSERMRAYKENDTESDNGLSEKLKGVEDLLAEAYNTLLSIRRGEE